MTNSWFWRRLGWIAANLALWLGLVVMYDQYLVRTVAEEYRLGDRTSTGGDSLGIPLFSFAIELGLLLLVTNVVLIAVRVARRRASRPVT